MKISESLKLTINSIWPLVVVVILFLIVGNFGINKILDLRSQISKSQSDQNILKGKLSLLQRVSIDVSTNTNIAVAALPENNPSLVVVSQLRTIALQNGISISGIKTGNEIKDDSGLSRVDISFEVDGPRPVVFSFLDAIGKIAPITLINKIKVSENSGSTRVEMAVKSYWSALPKTLPALTESISDLTSSEKAILTNISGLVQPVFVEVPASEGTGKTEPFGE